jgi:hypothetical protein
MLKRRPTATTPQVAGTQAHEHLPSPAREQQAKQSAEGGEQHAFTQ